MPILVFRLSAMLSGVFDDSSRPAMVAVGALSHSAVQYVEGQNSCQCEELLDLHLMQSAYSLANSLDQIKDHGRGSWKQQACVLARTSCI